VSHSIFHREKSSTSFHAAFRQNSLTTCYSEDAGRLQQQQQYAGVIVTKSGDFDLA